MFFKCGNSSYTCLKFPLRSLYNHYWTGLPILVELIGLVNSVVIFLSQMTLLRWSIFLFGSQTVILTVLLFWISFFVLYLFYNGFPSIRKFWYVIVSVSIDFLSNSQRDALFHRIAYDDYSFADWDGLRDHVRDVPCEDIFKRGFLVLLVTCEWV